MLECEIKDLRSSEPINSSSTVHHFYIHLGHLHRRSFHPHLQAVLLLREDNPNFGDHVLRQRIAPFTHSKRL